MWKNCFKFKIKQTTILFQITATSKEQWKLLLEQNSIGYVFPDEIQKSSSDCQQSTENIKAKSSEQDWQFVIPVPSPKASEEKIDGDLSEMEVIKDELMSINHDAEAINANDINQASGIFPAARARLASLRDLGAKKIGALKLKLIENKIKSNERGNQFHIKFFPFSLCNMFHCKCFIFLRSQSTKHHAASDNAHAKFCAGDPNHKNGPIFHRTISERHTFVECFTFLLRHAVSA